MLATAWSLVGHIRGIGVGTVGLVPEGRCRRVAVECGLFGVGEAGGGARRHLGMAQPGLRRYGWLQEARCPWRAGWGTSWYKFEWVGEVLISAWLNIL